VSRRLDGKVALITGAARGQGRSHAVRLAQEGADIIAIDLCAQIKSVSYPMATPGDLAQTVNLVEAQGQRILGLEADVRSLAALTAAVEHGRAEFGRLDIVSANAGIFSVGPEAHKIPEDTWRDVIDTDLTGAWHTAKATIPWLIEGQRGGSITLTSSAAGLRGYANVSHYVSAKHGLVGLMRSLALELAPHRIRVNSLHPSQVNTEMILHESTFKLFAPDVAHPTEADFAPVSQAMNALPTPWVEPIDVSNALLFLASEEARFITGVALPVDAGAVIK
jgi:SDR family mycofactocin-dependent oxidoreductase